MILRAARYFSRNFIKESLLNEFEEPPTTSPSSTFEKYHDRIRNQSKSSKFTKKINTSPIEQQEVEAYEKALKAEEEARNYFEQTKMDIDPLDEARIEKTKRVLRCLRLNNTIDFVREQKQPKFNDYSVYEKNFTYYKNRETHDPADIGENTNSEMVRKYVQGLAPDGSYENTLQEKLRQEERANKSIPESEKKLLEEKLKEYYTPLDPNETDLRKAAKRLTEYGRLSPIARETIYRLYEDGWTVNDLSHKYGILPARVKAVVWMKRHFYEEIAPEITATTWRLGLEREYLYASRFPFQDYGIDIQHMVNLSQGTCVIRLPYTEKDNQPDRLLISSIREYIKELKPIESYTIPRSTVGKGKKKYEVKDLVVHRGDGQIGVSYMFENICKWYHTPELLPEKVEKRLDQGPRIASFGYRPKPKFYKRFVKFKREVKRIYRPFESVVEKETSE